MARPQKCGMDYFPHDTDALTDEKIEALRMLYGNDGYAFYFILLERIYRTEQFELDISDSETIQILSRKIGITEELFNKMLNTALKRNCFDNSIYNERKCLTSAGIKKRADVVISKRIASKESYDKRVSVAETTQETHTETLQKVHKGEERKEKERKEEKKNIDNTVKNEKENNDVSDIEQINLFFEKAWSMYPNKLGKGKISDKKKKEIYKIGDDFIRAINRYVETKESWKVWQHGSTFFNSGYIDYLNENFKQTDKQIIYKKERID